MLGVSLQAVPGVFDTAVIDNDPQHRLAILEMLREGLRRVDPRRIVDQAITHDHGAVHIGDRSIAIGPSTRTTVIALGKAAPAMFAAAWPRFRNTRRQGLIISDHHEDHPDGVELIVAGHPVPTAISVEAASKALALVSESKEGDLVVVLVSGGGSALAELPVSGLDLEDLQATVELLLLSGAPIQDVNTVRRHLSAFKEGHLAIAASPATVATLILSDVVGDSLPDIASGPTVPDPTSFADAYAVLESRGLTAKVPAAVLGHLESGMLGKIPEAPRPTNSLALVVGNGALAAEGVRLAAGRLGVDARIATTTLTGDAQTVARDLAVKAGHGITIFAGETTVTVTGHGRGGRNQQAALSAATAIDGRNDRLFAAFATDGVDGPTDAAGAIVDGSTVARARALGFDAAAALGDNDAYPCLQATRDLLMTGPTGTNVGDVWITWRW